MWRSLRRLPPRSTTTLRSECRIPYRLDLAGGWLDQPFVSKYFPGLNRLDYAAGEYWPEKITSVNDPEMLEWIENHLWFITLPPREGQFNVLDETHISTEGARALAEAADKVWETVRARDIQGFGRAFKASFDAQVAMFPLMKSKTVRDTIELYKDKALGWKLAGAGGGGYLVLASERPIEKAIQVRIRRERRA